MGNKKGISLCTVKITLKADTMNQLLGIPRTWIQKSKNILYDSNSALLSPSSPR